MNAPSGFAGNLLDLYVNGVEELVVKNNGNVVATGNITADGIHGFRRGKILRQLFGPYCELTTTSSLSEAGYPLNTPNRI